MTDKTSVVEGVIAEHFGRGDSDAYAATYFPLAEKIVAALAEEEVKNYQSGT